MAPQLLKEFLLATPVESFVEVFWLNTQWYERFLVDRLHDIDVTVEEWTADSTNNNLRSRRVRCFHPSNISFPGLPSHAESLKSQSLEVSHAENARKAVVRESNSFNGIPYADYFTVHTEWICIPTSNKAECKVSVFLELRFVKSTWLQGTIESNTKAEVLQVVEAWLELASLHLRQQVLGPRLVVDASAADSDQNGLPAGDEDQDGGQEEGDEDRVSHKSADSDALSAYLSDEEEAMFYDCEEGTALLPRPARRNSTSASLSGPDTAAGMLSWARTRSGEHFLGSDKFLRTDACTSRSARPYDRHRDMAVQCVETAFVLAQFSFWQVYQFYAYDLKDLFNVHPEHVVRRIAHSFCPGAHMPVLGHPDLYGPLLAVLLLPQTLLLAMETARHGCTPTSQLGNAVAVCVLMWLGLALLYRLLALLVAPSLGIKQCLCVVGYSFFSWNLALLATLPLEHMLAPHGAVHTHHAHHHHHGAGAGVGAGHNVTFVSSSPLGVHADSVSVSAAVGGEGGLLPLAVYVPLLLFGLPVSFAQGYVFWEHTPASSMTLQPSALPPSMQQFATQHSRMLQRLLWALPKIAAFLLVAGTHTQLLWYVARVFLPGRRQLCRLSALMQPSQYADILTQKDLRLFALKLLSGHLDED